ncbi:carbohydrate kinase family protein [Natrinema caseinilyticum]|uniref:carbohydrate kinase family protein n=1 Tax=Natrinema caseinilyticum TaxID=2961570 RepID=UPI0020C4250B|nr:PfkB family carbohydrate kinase [Natrinema caseinilyticum]
MSYGTLRDRLDALEAGDGRHVVALPDGSVDHRYVLSGAGGASLRDVDEFAGQLADGSRAFWLESIDVQPGGQAVNAAVQVDALGDSATLVGHLDHPVLADFSFETHSMGPPATVSVVAFDGDDLLFSEPGPTEAWDVADLSAVVDWDQLVDADALCCANWVTIRGLTAVFDRLRSAPPDDPLAVVLDPGPLDAVEPAALADLFDALSRADAASDTLAVVLSVNPTELEAAVTAADGADGAFDGPPDRNRDRDRAASLRSAIDVTGVVSHGVDAAAGATRDGTAVVDMLEVSAVTHTTGAGDRFSAGLACALAHEWPLEAALALGNACAAHFVETGDTADPEAVRSLLDRQK